MLGSALNETHLDVETLFAIEAPRPLKTPVFLGGLTREDERLTDWFHGHRKFFPKAHSLDEGRQRQSKPYEVKIVLFPLETNLPNTG